VPKKPFIFFDFSYQPSAMSNELNSSVPKIFYLMYLPDRPDLAKSPVCQYKRTDPKDYWDNGFNITAGRACFSLRTPQPQ
jgi:hypothetical protein